MIDSTPTDLSGVRESGMCIGCGACVHADESISLTFNDAHQIYEPDGPGNAEAAAVCPAVAVDFERLQRLVFGAAPDSPLGVCKAVMLAQSRDYDRNLAASSGGLIKELLHELLARPEVDGAIVLRQVGGLDFEPALIRDPAEIDSLPGSIYHNLVFDKALSLLKAHPGRFVLVAIPCQLEGIYSYIFRRQPELFDRIYMTIGLLCGWQYTYHSLRAISQFKGIDYAAVESVSYRGGGPVGRLRIRANGREHAINRRVDIAYQVAFDRSFNIPRCHLCINHSNFLADLVVGDAWLPSTVKTSTGISLIICRSERAVDTMSALQANNRIVATAVTEEEVVESQTRRVAFGDFAYAYAEYLQEIGEHCPRMTGPNRAAAQLTSREAVARFHAENVRKLALQRAGKYWQLYLRKMTIGLRPFVYRYVRWLFVRLLKIKSLLGVRKEVPKEKLSDFR